MHNYKILNQSGAGCWKLSAIAYVAVDGVRHLESPATYNRGSFRCKRSSCPWRNLRQARRCLRICYAIAGGSAKLAVKNEFVPFKLWQIVVQTLIQFNAIIIIIIIIIYHDFLPTPRRGSHVKSDKTHTQSSRYTPLAHILDTWALIFSSCAIFTVYPNRIM